MPASGRRGLDLAADMVRVCAVLSLLPGWTGALASPGPQPAPPPPAILAPVDTPYPGVLRLEVDATDTARRILRVHETIPVSGDEMVLLYPQWIPGEHAPVGPISRVAGLVVTAGGRVLPWRRDPGDIFAFRVRPPDGVRSLDVAFDYLAAAASEISDDLLTLRWNRVLLYPAGVFARQVRVQARLMLPAGWRAASALPGSAVGAALSYPEVSLARLVDSPVFAGLHEATYDLAPGGAVPAWLHVFADSAAGLAIPAEQLAVHRALVRQAGLLFGGAPHAHYDFLLALTNRLGTPGGIEHRESGENIAPPDYLAAPGRALFGRDLLAHEYVHAWNGKFRRPATLWTANFNVPARDDLLWVYEGLTQYWGFVLAARAGLLPAAAVRAELARNAAYLAVQPGRDWRSLQDTTAQPLVGLGRDGGWGSWTRALDYYTEGMLLWLEVDCRIRAMSGGARSLDDVARGFFGAAAPALPTQTYDFAAIVRALQAVQPYDWAVFLRDRLDGTGTETPEAALRAAGYRVAFTDRPGAYLESLEARRHFSEFLYSLGVRIDPGGRLTTVLWDGPAFRAGVAEGTQVAAVNGAAYAPERLRAVLREAAGTPASVDLLLRDGEAVRHVAIPAGGGARYPHLVREGEGMPLLDAILAPREN